MQSGHKVAGRETEGSTFLYSMRTYFYENVYENLLGALHSTRYRQSGRGTEDP